MTVSQALAANKLVKWVLLRGRPDEHGQRVTEAEALASATLLIEKASQTLSAGLQPQDVERLWPKASFVPPLPHAKLSKKPSVRKRGGSVSKGGRC